jgi:hypothetical protein
MGAPSLPPGRYFRMHMVGYFERIASERGIAWRCSDSLSLRDFLRLESRERVPDHSWMSKTRGRLPHEVHERVFGWVLKLVAEHGLVRGKRIGVDASTREANAALRTIVHREDGRTYREMLTQMAKESGIDTPTADDLVRIDRARKGKRLSNEEWTSKTDPGAGIARLKDGRTHLAYKHTSDITVNTASGELTVHRTGADRWRVSLVETGLSAMTGGRLKRVRDPHRRQRCLHDLRRRRRLHRHHCSACLPSRSWAACDRHCGAAAWPLRCAGDHR